jgi:hypothetical protein
MGKMIVSVVLAVLVVAALAFSAGRLENRTHSRGPQTGPRVACCSHAAALVAADGHATRVKGFDKTVIHTPNSGVYCLTLLSLSASSVTPEVTADSSSRGTATPGDALFASEHPNCTGSNEVEVDTFTVSSGVEIPTDEGFSIVIP